MSFTKEVEKNKERFNQALDTIQFKYNCFDDVLVLKDKFPHLYRRLSILFSTKDCHDYINDLIVHDRNKRQGFPSGIWLLIQRIKTENEQFYKEEVKCVWDLI